MPALIQNVLVVALSILPCPASMQASGDSLTVTGSDGSISVQMRSLGMELDRLGDDDRHDIEIALGALVDEASGEVQGP